MRINQSTGYAIRMAVYLAQYTRPVPSSKLSDAIGVSPRYLLQIGSRLRDGGLIIASHGPNGGYELSKKPKEITLLDIIRIMERRTAFLFCVASTENMRNSSVLDTVYHSINTMVTNELEKITLESLLFNTTE